MAPFASVPEAAKGRVLMPAVKPKIVAMSPWWKLTMMLQVTTPPRPSTKNVSAPPSAPFPPTRKYARGLTQPRWPSNSTARL